ncbi:hypothetical protein [Parasitella parasitica]|uniref:Retrotransposon gag domain-containing protein n=1 Tax=Parasitella parasitica TaxID=35722 RepID=A0A0B7NHD8_9FUNG|nr:hypothetical protein [Parasitella parasitica]
MARWYANLMATQGRLTWSRFRTALVNKYGKSIIDTKDEAREQLEKLLYLQTDDLSKFLDKFQTLRLQADIQDEDCIIRYFLKALFEELANYIKYHFNTKESYKVLNVDMVLTKVVAIYNGLFKSAIEALMPTLKDLDFPCLSSESHLTAAQ